MDLSTLLYKLHIKYLGATWDDITFKHMSEDVKTVFPQIRRIEFDRNCMYPTVLDIEFDTEENKFWFYLKNK